jgi:vancomycin resistance protein YoaR
MPSDGRPRRFPFGKLVFAIVAAAVLVGAAGSGALVAYQGRYSDRIYPNVKVAGVAIGGMDEATARATLETGLAHYGEGTVTVTAGGKSIRIPFSAAKRRVDIESLLTQALAVGHTGDTVTRAADGVDSLLNGNELQPAILLDEGSLTAAVENAAVQVDSGMIDASAGVGKAGFTTTPAGAGQGLNRAEVVSAIRTALADPEAPSAVAISGSVAAITPDITDEDAAAAVAAATSMARDVVLIIGSDSFTISGATVRTWITFGRDASGAYMPAIADDAPSKAVAALTKKVNRAPVEATFTYSPKSSAIGVMPGKDGRTLDVAGTTALVVQAVRARAVAGAAVAAPDVAMAVTVKEPNLTTEAAKKAAPKMRKVSTWTTYYQVSSHNGFGANISIPAREINGTVVAPGATFDWWAALAPITDASLLRRGYKYGGAIINGHSAEGKAIAGGICSSSTTMFNAVARAGYQIDERYNHYYFIDRYPTGMDATVVYGSKNLRWTNDTKYPVLIRGWGTPGVVTFALYTVPVNKSKVVGGGYLKPGRPFMGTTTAIGRKVVIASSGLGNYRSPGAPITTPTNNPKLSGTIIDYPLPGFNVSVTRTVYENGKAIHRDSWYSHYQVMPLNRYLYKKPA